MAKLLIFDLDGTLFETGPAIHKTLVHIMEKRGLQELPYEAVRKAMGHGLEHLVKSLNADQIEKLGDFEILKKDFMEFYKDIFLDESPPFPGLLDFLDSWQGKLAIASNKLAVHVEAMVKHTEISKYSWSSATGGDSFEVKKPEPKQLLHAMEVAGTTPQETLMIGDGLPDILAAKAAGVRSVAVTFGYDDPNVLEENGASAFISHYDELPKIIDQFSQ